MIDPAKLDEMRRQFDRLRQMEPRAHYDADTCSDLLDTAIALRRLIDEHNAECDERCAVLRESDGYAGICLRYAKRPRGCPQCPKGERIEVPAGEAVTQKGSA